MGRHERVLAAVFSNPVRPDIPWNRVEAMLRHLGAEKSQGSGSRVRFALNGVRAVFHRPHPARETDRGTIVSLRRFLIEAGIRDRGCDG